jgi:hypothetical protein
VTCLWTPRCRLALPLLLALCLAPAAVVAQAQDTPPQREAFDTWLDAQAQAALAARTERLAAMRTADEVIAHGAHVRASLEEMVGGVPSTDAPLHARITRTQQRDGYRIEHLLYESLPGLRVTALVYVPDGTGPFPAVLGTAGHAAEGKAAPIYQHAWISLARRGFLVLAYDPPGQGERLEYLDPATGESRIGFGVREHVMTGQQLMLTGSHIGAYMAQDGRRAIDYLETRPDVDATRIAVAGNSGGGTQAALLGVFEPRLAAVVVSCYMTSWQHMWNVPGPQDAEQIIPGFVSQGFDFGDYALATVPRGFLISSAIQDFFPIAGARQTFERLRPLYALLDRSDRLAMVENDATHGWSQPLREGAYRWLGTWLGNAGHPPAEAPVTPDAPESLHVTTSGQLASSEGSVTIRALHADHARALAGARAPVTPDALRSLLALPADPPAPRIVSRHTDAARAGREHLVIEVEPGVQIRGVLDRAGTSAGAAAAPALLVIDDRGIDDPSTADALADGVQTVLRLEVRGTGALGPAAASGGYTATYQFAGRAWLLGTSVPAWQTRDTLAGLAVLRAEAAGATSRILHARGATAPAALFAAQFDRPDAVVLEDSLVSYLDLATADVYEDASLLVVPGILRVTDLPALMGRIAPARVTLRHPKTPDGQPISRGRLIRHLGVAVPINVEIAER